MFFLFFVKVSVTWCKWQFDLLLPTDTPHRWGAGRSIKKKLRDNPSQSHIPNTLFVYPISGFYTAFLFAVREAPRCSSRTATWSFAKDNVAVREQQMKTTSKK